MPKAACPRTPAPGSTFSSFQKNRADLSRTRELLGLLGVQCGQIHNPSARRDPDYWRFYVLAASHRQFIDLIGSWHPRKRPLLDERAISLSIGAATGDKLSATRERDSCRSVP